MLVVMAFALRGAGVAGAGAEFEHFPQDRSFDPLRRRPSRVVASHTSAQSVHRRMHWVMSMLSAEQASAQRQAHLRAIHRVVDRVAERLVDVTLDGRVQRDHLANGHGISFLRRLSPEPP